MASNLKSHGGQDYWVGWGKRTAEIAGGLICAIRQIVKNDEKLKDDFAEFLMEVRDTLNPSVSEEAAVEMLAQHILTLPIFQEFFPDSDFYPQNAVGRAMRRVVHGLRGAGVEVCELDKFYADARRRIRSAQGDDSKQDVMRSLYDTFFQTAFPRMADRLGIVYTPIPVVDFILKSVQFALKEHFGRDLGDAGVQILDPFAGMGTFLERLIRLELIERDKLPDKYANEMHANEILLLPYYIASVNIAKAYEEVTGEHKPFPGMMLGDTFLEGVVKCPPL
jgi:predicted helicase